jgi:hypothetical protein
MHGMWTRNSIRLASMTPPLKGEGRWLRMGSQHASPHPTPAEQAVHV